MKGPRFIFYGGKGGVGKTTCAAARAIAEAASGASVLIASTDPAHSLGDALEMKLSTRPAPVGLSGRRGKLDAVELDASRAFTRWLRRHRGALGDILEHGTWLDRAEVERLLDLPVPGIDELIGLIELTRLASGSSRDLVIVDTAPTGHTLRLLAAPQTVSALAGVLDELQEQHRYVRRRFGVHAERGGGAPAQRDRGEGAPGVNAERGGEADRLIELIAKEAAAAGRALRDAKATVFHWVTLAEPLSIAESEHAVAALTRSGMTVDEVVVNHVLHPGGAPGTPCALCDRRRRDQREALAAIRERLGRGRRLRLVPEELHEPRGVRALASLARRTGHRMADLAERGRGAPAERDRGAGGLGRRAPPESLDACRGARLLFVAGKGGVGKTTVAAAVALKLARAMPDRPLLLLSTDPAPSLGDVFGTRVGDRPVTIPRGPANLSVREVNAPRVLDEKRAALEAALDEIAASLGSTGISGGRGGAELMKLAPPGIDELLGMLSVIEARAAYSTIVTDMAPTGHALRLLEMPDVARAWIQALLRVLLTYRSLVRPGRMAEELVETSRSIRELQALLHDRKTTRFLVVTRAASVPRAETVRLLRRLRRFKLTVGAVIVNALTLSPGACPRCETIADGERRELALLRRGTARMGDCAIIQAPLAAPPPRGVRGLQEWAARWIG